jgi:hypothetical protein
VCNNEILRSSSSSCCSLASDYQIPDGIHVCSRFQVESKSELENCILLQLSTRRFQVVINMWNRYQVESTSEAESKMGSTPELKNILLPTCRFQMESIFKSHSRWNTHLNGKCSFLLPLLLKLLLHRFQVEYTSERNMFTSSSSSSSSS